MRHDRDIFIPAVYELAKDLQEETAAELQAVVSCEPVDLAGGFWAFCLTFPTVLGTRTMWVGQDEEPSYALNSGDHFPTYYSVGDGTENGPDGAEERPVALPSGVVRGKLAYPYTIERALNGGAAAVVFSRRIAAIAAGA